MTTFVGLIPKTYILGHLIAPYCPCTLCARITNVVIWRYFGKDLTQFLKTIFLKGGGWGASEEQNFHPLTDRVNVLKLCHFFINGSEFLEVNIK